MNNYDESLILKYVPEKDQKEALEKLATGYPVQYIIGNVDFYNQKIEVNEDVLIPRFETEYLVKDLIELINGYGFSKPKILDIGTGSGCISIALKNSIDSNVTGIDKSMQAIILAKKNAKINNAEVKFVNDSIEEYKCDTKYDVIVSNPPYVPKGSIVDEKIKYEPKEAIYADENGLYFYKVILNKSSELLNQKNIIAFEIGDREGKSISDMAKSIYPNAKIILKNDLNGYERYLYIINE